MVLVDIERVDLLRHMDQHVLITDIVRGEIHADLPDRRRSRISYFVWRLMLGRRVYWPSSKRGAALFWMSVKDEKLPNDSI
jgi:hypothetical protein